VRAREIGKRQEKHEPAPSRLTQKISPPAMSSISFATASPNPWEGSPPVGRGDIGGSLAVALIVGLIFCKRDWL
jgi:hypothetical protein